jgi:hypothetical protein
MWTCWYLFGLIMIGTNRWFHYVSDKNNYVHAFFGWATAACMIWDVCDIIVNDRKAAYSGNHRKWGWVMMFSLSVFTVSGVGAFMARKLLKWDTRTIQYIRYFHRLIAITFWAASLYALWSGMQIFL